VATTRVSATDEVRSGGPDLVLSREEQERADALHRPADRDDFVAARLLARLLVAEHVGTDPAEVRFVQVCERCGGPHGRPRVVGHDVHVSWAHSAGLVAATVDDAPCAIDVESVARLREGELPLGVLTDSERSWLEQQHDQPRAFAELWVRKEVLVKLGDATLDAVTDVDVAPSLSGLPVLARTIVAVDTAPWDAVAAWGGS
jgi:4'-phosphopantetheinyl transferase